MIGTLSGSGTKKIMLQGQLATGCEPGILNRQPHKRDGNKLCGLGTADDKRGIAVILDALKSLADAGWKDCATVPVRSNADEETGSANSGEPDIGQQP